MLVQAPVGKLPWSRKWQPTPVFLPGECHGQTSLGGCGPWGRTESDTTEHSQTYKMFSVCLDCLTFSIHASLASNPPGSKLTSAIPVISGGPSGLRVFFILVFFFVFVLKRL